MPLFYNLKKPPFLKNLTASGGGVRSPFIPLIKKPPELLPEAFIEFYLGFFYTLMVLVRTLTTNVQTVSTSYRALGKAIETDISGTLKRKIYIRTVRGWHFN